jgi:trehalose 6-phosphate phosphatase
MADRDANAPASRVQPTATRRGPPPRLDRGVALFLDIDGTLIELTTSPELARVDGGVAARLPELAGELDGAVALITGRAIVDADRLFPALVLPIAGQHGAERRAADGTLRSAGMPAPAFASMRRELERFAARHQGVKLEDKGLTLALHYRQAPRLASHVHRTMRAHIARDARRRGFRLQPGKGILEIQQSARNKGTAIAEFMSESPFRGRTPVFLGDDRTDEYGFATVTRMGGWSVKVGRGPTGARYRLPDVAAVRRWLAGPLLAEREAT